MGYKSLLEGKAEREGKCPDGIVYKFKFSDEDRKELTMTVALPNVMGVNGQNVDDVVDTLYFSGFSARSKNPILDEALGRYPPVLSGPIEDEDGYVMQVKNKGIVARQDLGIPYSEPALQIFFSKFATWADYLTGEGLDIPGGIIPPRWFRNKLEKGAIDFANLNGDSDLLGGFRAGQYLGITYKNLLKLEKLERPYLAVHQGEDKSKLEIITNVADGLTEKVLDRSFTKSGDYWEAELTKGWPVIGWRRRTVRVSKADKKIKINFFGGKIKSPKDISAALTALHGYLYPPPPEQSE